jgi:hypothetical protein
MTQQPENNATARWVTPGVPTFAVVGKVNMGKSAVLATLLEEDDNAVIRISSEPGETTRCQCLRLELDGDERLRFIDTPGFQQPVEALRVIRALADDPARGPGPETLVRFVERYRDSADFVDECRLLEPLLEGAGVLYVVDPAVPVHDAFIAEIEILRLSAGPRLAVLNPHNRRQADHSAAYVDAWRSQLGQAFNLVRTFDAHAARYAARRDLLAAEWAQRREDAAERIQAFLRAALAVREHVDYADGETPDAARRQAVQTATRRYYQRLSHMERDASNDLLDLYRHGHTRAATGVALDDDLDLASDETWRRLGLTRRQLAVVGAAVGAGAGLTVDAGALGHTLGLGTLLGGVGGGALAYFKGDALPTLSLAIGRRGAVGGRRLTLGPPKNANFAWILLDSVLIRYRLIVNRSHALRGDGTLAATSEEASETVVKTLASARQKQLARWFKNSARGRCDDAQDTEARQAIEATLAELEADERR